jgi:hypothetical protein
MFMNVTVSHAPVIIDPRNDFCDQRGSLYVEGASAQGETPKKQNLRLLADCTSPVASFDRQSSLDRVSEAGVSCVTAE